MDDATGLLKVGTLSGYGDALSISPSASTESDPGLATQVNTTQAASSQTLTLAFPADPDNASEKPDANRRRGR